MLRPACDTGDHDEPRDHRRARPTRGRAGAYADLRRASTAGEPWPQAEAFGTEPEASWGPREVLAHVDEMLPYWLGELERVLDGDGRTPVPFGRMAEDPIRIGLIGRDRTLPLRVLFDRIDAGLTAWSERLDDADVERAGDGRPAPAPG